MKFYSICFCLFLLLNFSPSFQQSACESVEEPSGFSSCKGKTTSSDAETCCYSKYHDSDGDGTECIEINSEDAGDNLESTLYSILDGEYWEDYTATYSSLQVDCGNGAVSVSEDITPNEFSQCQSVENPSGFSSCEGKKTSSNSETCCYAYNDDDKECVEIKKEDAEDEDKLKAAIEKIKKGQYWQGYEQTFDKLDIECSSGFLKGIFVALFAFFLL